MEKPRILIFTTSYYPFMGGAEVAIQEIGRRLRERFDFYIVTARFRRNLPRREIRPEGTIIRVGFGASLDKWLLPVLAIWNLELGTWNFPKRQIVLWGVDIGQGTAAAALWKLLHPKIPFIFNIQYGYGENRISQGRLGAINFAFRFILKRADRVSAISSYLLDLARSYGYKGPAEVVHNGVDVAKFTKHSTQNTNKAQNTKHKTIITTSRLVQKNGIDILIKAVAEVKKIIPGIRCHIVGDGQERNSYQLLVTSYQLEANVKFFGSVPYEDIPNYLQEADVFVRSSRSEGMGNSFIEALAAGLPIIGTPVGGITDIIKDPSTGSGQATGLFARVDDPKDLAEKIIHLLEDRELRERIVRNGRRMVEERFSWEKIAEKYAHIFYRSLTLIEVKPLFRTKSGTCSGLSSEHSQGRVNPLKVLVTTPLFPPDIGGPATYSKTLFDELPKFGFRVDVLPFREVRAYPKIIRHFLYFLKIFRQGAGADIIFAQDPVSVGLPSALAAKALGQKFILKIVGDYAWEQGVERFGVKDLLDHFGEHRYGYAVEILKIIQRYAAKSARKIVVPSNYLKRIVIKWGVPSEKIIVIYNSFDVPAPSYPREERRKKLGLGGFVIISAGRLVPWKGFETLIEVVGGIAEKIPDIRLFIIGSGPEEERLKQKVKEMGLENAVVFTGQITRDKLLSYLEAGDVFVLNTGYEGLPHVILEAMAMGIPVITTASGGNAELVEDGVNALVTDYNDAESIGSAIWGLYRNPVLARRISANAKITLKKFDRSKMIKETVNLLRSLSHT